MADLIFDVFLGRSDQFDGVGVGPADLAGAGIDQHDSGGIVFKNSGKLLLPIRQGPFGAPADIDTALGVNAEENDQNEDRQALPDFMDIRGKYVLQERALSENGDVHQRFQEPVQQSDSDSDPYKILSRKNRV